MRLRRSRFGWSALSTRVNACRETKERRRSGRRERRVYTVQDKGERVSQRERRLEERARQTDDDDGHLPKTERWGDGGTAGGEKGHHGRQINVEMI